MAHVDQCMPDAVHTALYETYLPDFDRGLAGKRTCLFIPIGTTALEPDVHWLYHKPLIYHF